MPRKDDPIDELFHGRLAIERSNYSEWVEVFYIPSVMKLAEFNIPAEEAERHSKKLLEVNYASGQLTMYPIYTVGGQEKYLTPKYVKIKKIKLECGKPVYSLVDGDSSEGTKIYSNVTFGPTTPLESTFEEVDRNKLPNPEDAILRMLESLPPAFTKDYDYGLGLAKEYRFIIDAVEKLTDCIELVISDEKPTGIGPQGSTFCISLEDFEAVRRLLNNIKTAGQKASKLVRESKACNFIAEKLGRPLVPEDIGNHPLQNLFAEVLLREENTLSPREQDKVLGVMGKNVRSIVEAKPEKLVSLRNDIELVNLDRLIVLYEEMLSVDKKEEEWQSFFSTNQFILSLAFGFPIVMVGEKATVGGIGISGTGGTVTDYLVRNSCTNNIAIIEIKTPQTVLLNKGSYRRGVFAPSSDLSGAVNQTLDQKNKLESDFSTLNKNSNIGNVESYWVHCCLIVGTMPCCKGKVESFELYRGNSKNVDIVTFDELLAKLKNLQSLLNPLREENNTPLEDSDLPF